MQVTQNSKHKKTTKSSTYVNSCVRHDFSLLTQDDLFLFNEGKHFRLYDKLGSHVIEHEGVAGTYFAVWAPDAHYVSVIGDFNHFDPGKHPLKPCGNSGIWEGFVPEAQEGMCYKYHVASRYHGHTSDRADPFAQRFEHPPRSASVIWSPRNQWSDQPWMEKRKEINSHQAPISIYELHLASWMRVPEEGNRPLTYREMAPKLADYVKRMGFTHVEFLPVMEHPFDGSWGYQTLGYFAPTSRFGSPDDFAFLVDHLHQNDIGVILDWVPSHFPSDAHGLAFFDGTHLYEHADPRLGFHPDWKSCIFNHGRNEVRSFLISSALFWLDRYHADGLRVDAVASMLYLDYSRKEGEWIPNHFGGNENLEAIEFLRMLNAEVYKSFPDVQTMAEESTSWPAVSRPTYLGGLGFGMKWDMGWMHDSLVYCSKEPVHRKWHHNLLSFRMLYAWHENFVLPLSHDEVVHGKGSLLNKMPGDAWQKFANLRLLLGYMYAQSGKKLLFMGGEFGQWDEWNYQRSLDWHLTEFDRHRGMQQWVSDLNRVYRNHRSMHVLDFHSEGFEWVDCQDTENSVISFLRRDPESHEFLLFVFNFTPVPRQGYRIGVPRNGHWEEILNSDAPTYWGSGIGNQGGRWAEDWAEHGRPHSLCTDIPPLGMVVFRWRQG